MRSAGSIKGENLLEICYDIRTMDVFIRLIKTANL